MKLEIGCADKKREGWFGLDLHPDEGVDLVQDLDDTPWRIEDSCCEEIYANQVIEHVRDLRSFFTEMYRVAADGCRIKLTTPHFSSYNSWADPTHLHHLSVCFTRPFETGGYLAAQIPGYRVERARITFGSFLWTWPGRLICGLFGYKLYEQRFCWIFPASSVVVELVVDKSSAQS